MANEFNAFFTNIGQKLAANIETPNNKAFHDYLQNPCNNQFQFHPVLNDDIIEIKDKLKPKSSKGHDRMSSTLIKKIKKEISEPLTYIINQCIVQHIFPDKLKLAKILPIYKKDNENLLENYRPISILPAISKILEKVIANQINQYFINNNLFYPSQYGFRQSHSTELTALEIIDRITYLMDQNKLPLNIYIDLSKAFDTIDHTILLHKLQHYGFNGSSLALMENYLTNRQQYVNFQNTNSSLLNITTGVPQGSILGPLLFIIYINDIPNSSKLLNFISYADDTTLFVSLNYNHDNSTDNFSPNSSILNNEIKLVSDWLSLNKLSLNTSKTKCMTFHSKKKTINSPILKIENTAIEHVQNFQFLGIMLNKHLNWDTHINHIAKKISKTIGILNRLKRTLPTFTLKTIYNSLINSHINYGILCWGYKSNKILKLQKKAVRVISNSKFNAHTQPLFKSLKILTINDMLT